MQAFHCDHFTLDLPTGHSFPMSKYRLLREAVERELPAIRLHEAPPASDGELALVHAPHWPRVWPPTWPVARTTHTRTTARAIACSTTSRSRRG